MANAREGTVTAVEDPELRSRLLKRMTSAGMASLLLMLPLIYLRSRATGDVFLTAAQACTCLVLIIVLLLRRRFLPTTHAVVFLVGLFVLAFSAMARIGFAAPGAIAAPFIPIFAAIVFGRRVSLGILAICIVVGVFIAVLHVSGVIRPAVDLRVFLRAPSAWATILFVQFALAAWYLFTISPIHEAERRTTARLDAVIDGLNDALFIHDKDSGAVLQVNQTMCTMYGYSKADVKDLSLDDLSAGVSPYDEAHAKEWISRAAVSGPQLFEWRAKARSGRLFWVEVNMRVVRMGDVDRLLAVVRDITQRKQADVDLALLQHSIDVHPDAVYWLDEENRLVFFNRAAYANLGYAADDILGKDVSLVNPLATPERIRLVWNRVREVGAYRAQTIHRRKDGTEFPVEITTTHIQVAGKSYLCGFAQDISERLRHEEEQRAMQARMNHAQRLEAIGTLAGGIAHDFNNILGAIIGYTDLAIQELPERSEARNMMQNVERGAQRAGDLVRQILTFSRRESQETRAMQLGPIVKEALKLIRASLPATIDVQETVSSREWIKADVGQIHQIVMNLCTNAGLAMRETGGLLSVCIDDINADAATVARHPGLLPGHFCRLRVGDTGSGIAPEIRERIFEPFFTTRPVGEGTGLGLSVVHGIVKNLTGSIHVDTEIGKGSTFEILFPVVQDRHATENSAEMIRGGKERILFVDDEPDLVEVARRGLVGLGYSVETFTDPRQAIETFRTRSGEFDLLVTDVTMPGMLGNVLAERVREIRPDLPIILVSGNASEFTAEKAKVAGFDGYLEKPLRTSVLSQTLRQLLDARRSSSARVS